MTDDSEVARIAAGLTKAERDRDAIVSARPADSFEWWIKAPIGRPDLDGGDGVLTPLGIAVRSYLQSKGGDA